MKLQQFIATFQHYRAFSLQDIRLREPSFGLANLYRWQKEGYVTQITRGRYTLHPPRQETELFSLANTIYQPSYISMESALRYYDIIPEGVFVTTSCSTKKTQTLLGDCGRFVYYSIKPSLYRGYNLIGSGPMSYLMASPAKVIGDMLYLKKADLIGDRTESRWDIDRFKELTNPEELRSTAQRFGSSSLVHLMNNFLLYRDSSGSASTK